MALAGRMKSPLCRRPTRPVEGKDLAAIKDALRGAGMLQREAA